MITFKQATTNDTELIRQVAIPSFLESHGHSAGPKDIADYIAKKFSLEAIQEELNNYENIFHVIFYNNKPAGYSKIIFNTPYRDLTPVATTKMERLYLLQAFYNLKLGTALFDYAAYAARVAGQEGMWLQVWTGNERAVKFYLKTGFKIIAEDGFKVSETHTNPNHIMYFDL